MLAISVGSVEIIAEKHIVLPGTSIQAKVDLAEAGDSIVILAGTYRVGGGYRERGKQVDPEPGPGPGGESDFRDRNPACRAGQRPCGYLAPEGVSPLREQGSTGGGGRRGTRLWPVGPGAQGYFQCPGNGGDPD